MPSRQDVQKLNPGQLVELFEVDATAIDGPVEYFHAGTDVGRLPIVWQGNTYIPWGMTVEGFEINARGQTPTPKVNMSNFGAEMTVRCIVYQDMIGAKFTRRRVFARYLDGMPGADPNAGYPDDIFFLSRKISESRDAVAWELESSMDVEGLMFPKRAVIPSCQAVYRGPVCSYAGPPVAMQDNTPTSDPLLDRCSQTVAGCQLRFGIQGPLMIAGCPGAARR